jgi:hypothetical protein
MAFTVRENRIRFFQTQKDLTPERITKPLKKQPPSTKLQTQFSKQAGTMWIKEISKTFAVIFIVIAGYLLLSLWQNNKSITDIRKRLEIGEAEIIVLANCQSRSRTVRKRLAYWSDYFTGQGWPVSMVVNGNPPKFSKIIPAPFELSMPRNRYLVFAGNIQVEQGSVLENENILLEKLSWHLGIAPEFHLNEIITLGANVTGTPFASLLSGKRPPLTIAILFESICSACTSGKSLYAMDRFARDFPHLDFRFWTLAQFSRDEVDQIRSDQNLTVGFSSLTAEMVELWESIPSEGMKTHPFQGLMMAIEGNGKVVFTAAAEDIHSMKDFLENYPTHRPQPLSSEAMK